LKNTAFLQRFSPLTLLRGSTFLVLLCASLLVITGLDSTILSWSYMSMGLRGSAVFAGLVTLVFLKRWYRLKAVLVCLYLLPPIYIILNLFY
jgi:SSS family solute:Na+ symporter